MSFYVYIMASRSQVLYVGVTNHLALRVREHKDGTGAGFTHRYRVDRLVCCEIYSGIRDALLREKQIKGWLRPRKIALIESTNPEWEDLSGRL
jgi:putative endonuclease